MAGIPLMVVPSVQQSQLPGPFMDDRAPLKRGDQGGQEMQRFGQNLIRAGSDFDRIAAEQAAVLNESTVKDLHAQATDAVSKILYDPDTGYMNQRGKGALDTFDAASKAVQGAMDELSAKATNPEQQRMFKQVAQQTLVAAAGAMRQHASQQNNVYQMDSSVARESAAADLAKASFNPVPGSDNTAYNQAVATQTIELREQARLKGLSPEETAAYVRRGQASTLVGVIDHLLANNQTKGAKDYFAGVRDQLPTEVADKVSRVLEVSANKDDALSLALDVKSRAGNIGAQEDELDSMFKAGKITAEVHEMALQKLRADNAQRRGEQAENDKSVLGAIWDMKNKNPGLTLADLPVGTINYIKTRGLGPHVDSILRPDGDAKVDDTVQFVQLMHMAADDPAGFANTDLLKLGLSKGNVQRFAAMQASIDKKDAVAQSTNKLMSGAVRTAVGEIKAAGINPGAKAGTTDAENYAAFQSAAFNALQEEADARRAAKMPPMKDADAREIVLGVVKKEVLGGTGVMGFFKTDGPAYKLVDKIPDDQRTLIVQALRAKGKPVTPAAIIELFNARHQ